MKIVENNQLAEISKLVPNKFNPKRPYADSSKGKRMFDDLKKSLKKGGQVIPVLVREVEKKFEIVNGYHRWKAMQELGFKKVEIKNLGKISYGEAVKYALSTEMISNPIDNLELASLLKKMREDDELISIQDDIPLTMEEIDDKIDMINFNFEDYEIEDLDDDKIVITIECETREQRNFIRKSLKEISGGKSLSATLEELLNNAHT